MARPRIHPVRQKAGVSVGMELIDGEEFIQKLQALAWEVQNTISEAAIDAGTKPVLSAMIANTPGDEHSRDKQSKDTRRKWSGAKPLKTTIRAVSRKKKRFGIVNGAIGLVGPSYSDGGGHGNLFSKDHDRMVFWGADMQQARRVNQFVKRTADETKSAASAAVTSALKTGIEAAANRMAK